MASNLNAHPSASTRWSGRASSTLALSETIQKCLSCEWFHRVLWRRCIRQSDKASISASNSCIVSFGCWERPSTCDPGRISFIMQNGGLFPTNFLLSPAGIQLCLVNSSTAVFELQAFIYHIVYSSLGKQPVVTMSLANILLYSYPRMAFLKCHVPEHIIVTTVQTG